MWCAAGEVDTFNRNLVRLEQDLLAVLRGATELIELASSQTLRETFTLIDRYPRLSVAMTRIKSSHAMTPRHGLNVMLLARAWMVHGHKLGDKLDDFSRAALFHDLGHWRPDDLVYLFGPFTHEQARTMRQHVFLDKETGLDARILEWIEQHHEQPDGKGYPKAIKTPHILAQALRIVDCFEGLTTPRRFRLSYSYKKAMDLMKKWAGHKFDAGLYRSFQDFIGSPPFGTYVRLQSRESAIVLPSTTRQNRCLVLSNDDSDPLEEPFEREVHQDEITGESHHWQEIPLPPEWRALRPDMMGLPRFYEDPPTADPEIGDPE